MAAVNISHKTHSGLFLCLQDVTSDKPAGNLPVRPLGGVGALPTDDRHQSRPHPSETGRRNSFSPAMVVNLIGRHGIRLNGIRHDFPCIWCVLPLPCTASCPETDRLSYGPKWGPARQKVNFRAGVSRLNGSADRLLHGFRRLLWKCRDRRM